MSQPHKQLRNKERTQKSRVQLEACDDLCLSQLSTRLNEKLHAGHEAAIPQSNPDKEWDQVLADPEQIGAPPTRTCCIC